MVLVIILLLLDVVLELLFQTIDKRVVEQREHGIVKDLEVEVRVHNVVGIMVVVVL